MQIVNQTVPRALRALGYQDESIEAIVEYIAEHGHVVDAPGLRPEHYEVMVREVTAERVKEHFRELCRGRVERFELPNIGALNFLLHESLGGGGTLSLMTDAQGKTFSTALLRMEIEVTDQEVADLHG